MGPKKLEISRAKGRQNAVVTSKSTRNMKDANKSRYASNCKDASIQYCSSDTRNRRDAYSVFAKDDEKSLNSEKVRLIMENPKYQKFDVATC